MSLQNCVNSHILLHLELLGETSHMAAGQSVIVHTVFVKIHVIDFINYSHQSVYQSVSCNSAAWYLSKETTSLCLSTSFKIYRDTLDGRSVTNM